MTVALDTAAHPGLVRLPVERAAGGVEDDWIAVEEPLEIRVDGEPLAVTLRTPGADRELAAGFLLSEGVIDGREAIEAIEPVPDPARPGAENVIGVLLRPGFQVDRERLREARRSFVTTAACGVCGKPSLASLARRRSLIEPFPCSFAAVQPLPERLRGAQRLYAATGGIHAAGLFDAGGRLLVVGEDIGRHNAVDKVIGSSLLAGRLPLARHVLVVSGRAGFEIVQKALAAGVPALVAVGAASSLAVRLAREAGMELFSFVAGRGGNRHVAVATSRPLNGPSGGASYTGRPSRRR